MISEYLEEQKKSEETSTLPAMDSLVGELIIEVIQLDPERYMTLMESGSSVILHTAGSFSVYNVEATLNILNRVKESFGQQANAHSRVSQALKQLSDNGKEEEEKPPEATPESE